MCRNVFSAEALVVAQLLSFSFIGLLQPSATLVGLKQLAITSWSGSSTTRNEYVHTLWMSPALLQRLIDTIGKEYLNLLQLGNSWVQLIQWTNRISLSFPSCQLRLLAGLGRTCLCTLLI